MLMHRSSSIAPSPHLEGMLMACPTHSQRNITLLSVLTLGSGYFIVKSKTLADKQRERAAGDYSVSVDRSGTSVLIRRHATRVG